MKSRRQRNESTENKGERGDTCEAKMAFDNHKAILSNNFIALSPMRIIKKNVISKYSYSGYELLQTHVTDLVQRDMII